uniref:Uncharacterized protein n=1 Tax=Oryza sativa subsp. japonica TaxID=39947 RepID=Q6YWZ7_ORYSJ|nr:hypothetical protein [Oryza sativa Japonica Group]BAC99883.1 hypothetical protein [Oryza sativa Japonica Group]
MHTPTDVFTTDAHSVLRIHLFAESASIPMSNLVHILSNLVVNTTAGEVRPTPDRRHRGRRLLPPFSRARFLLGACEGGEAERGTEREGKDSPVRAWFLATRRRRGPRRGVGGEEARWRGRRGGGAAMRERGGGGRAEERRRILAEYRSQTVSKFPGPQKISPTREGPCIRVRPERQNPVRCPYIRCDTLKLFTPGSKHSLRETSTNLPYNSPTTLLLVICPCYATMT